MISEKRKNMLYQCAKKAAKFSYSPYSRFPVGAAVLTKKGKIFLGTNVENASYGLTICAERVAISNALSSGHKQIIAIAIYSKRGQASPCGACRQFIIEFGKNIEVIMKKEGEIISKLISNLLIDNFDKRGLK